jgi:acyl dehydratase
MRAALPELQFDVTEQDALEWSAILDDRNPLHSNPEAAVAHGVGRGVVNPGPANMGYLMTLLLRSFPGATLEAFEARFVAVVLAPTKAVARGVVEREEAAADGIRLHCALELHSAGRVAITARARLRAAQHQVSA